MPKISALPSAARASQDDELPAHNVADGETQKLTVGMLMPTGTILDFAGATAPDGFLMCYGQSLNASTNPEYADLYDIIGTTYGGSGITAFNVPDLRGRVVAGQDDMGGSSANRLTGASGGVDGDVLGGVGGAETHTLTTAQMPAHNHPMDRGRWFGADSSIGTSGSIYNQTATTTAYGERADGTGNQQVIGNTGGGGAHNNVQPTIILNKIIKY